MKLLKEITVGALVALMLPGAQARANQALPLKAIACTCTMVTQGQYLVRPWTFALKMTYVNPVTGRVENAELARSSDAFGSPTDCEYTQLQNYIDAGVCPKPTAPRVEAPQENRSAGKYCYIKINSAMDSYYNQYLVMVDRVNDRHQLVSTTAAGTFISDSVKANELLQELVKSGQCSL